LVFFFFVLQWQRRHDNSDASTITMAAPCQWRQLNNDGSGVSMTTMVTAPRRRRRLHDNDGGTMVAVVAKTQLLGLNKDGGGQQWRRLHDDGNGFTTTVAAPR
jgi:hypothetical protein